MTRRPPEDPPERRAGRRRAGQVDRHVETIGRDRRLEELTLDPIEHQLGPPEHLEAAIRADVTPREVDEAVASLAVHCGSAEVDIDIADDLDVDFPVRLGLVSSDEMRSVATHLHTNMHVLHQRPIRSPEPSARQVGAE